MTGFPFAALVGQDRLKTALLVAAVDPSVGGVLICGEKGTAKSTAARALAELLPPIRVRRGCPFHSDPDLPAPSFDGIGGGTAAGDAGGESPTAMEISVPFVEVPLGATEDRVIGTLDLQQVLSDRRRVLQPGLLAAANRGILYVDEVNLLADHLVDLLLDAAASGVNRIERDGMQVSHPSRFLLIGTMNPEEGRLRPQLLDRFGLTVDVAAPRDPKLRVEVLQRCIEADRDGEAFLARWQAAQRPLRSRVVSARERLPDVAVSEAMLYMICGLCSEMQVDGLRADIAMQKVARALAALAGSDAVTPVHVREAAEFVLPHRLRRGPMDKPSLDPEQLDAALKSLAESAPQQEAPENESAPGNASTEDGSRADNPDFGEASTERNSPVDASEPAGTPEPADSADDTCSPSSAEAGSSDHAGDADRGQSEARPQAFAADDAASVPTLRLRADESLGTTPGRRNTAAQGKQGRFVRAVPDPRPTELAVNATVRAAAIDAAPDSRELAVATRHLHARRHAGKTGTLILLVVDASGSMAARRRMEAVKGTVQSLLVDAYQQRDRVGVIAFRGPQAELVLPPTSGQDLAWEAFDRLPTGGRTPLAHALTLTLDTVRRERLQEKDQAVLVVVLTDGKANVPLPGSDAAPWQQTISAARKLAGEATAALVLDTEQDFVKLGRARELAEAMQAEYRSLDSLDAETLTLHIGRARGGSTVRSGAGR